MSSACRAASSAIRRALVRRLVFLLTSGLTCTACAGADDGAPHSGPEYAAAFEATFRPGQPRVDASISIAQSSPVLRELSLSSSGTLSDMRADGELTLVDGRWRWRVPEAGGTLRYRVHVDHKRGDAFDARVADDWAVLRLGDVFPPARVRSLKGAHSRSTLSLSAIEADGESPNWSFETRYGPVKARPEGDVCLPIERNFNRPTGWLAAGELGVRREQIAGLRVAVASPVGSGFRRMDALAFLSWTLPELLDVFPPSSDRLLIVGAPRSMWRGGLSGPDSFYLHAGRPLVSENGTSTLLHELVHVLRPWQAAEGDDWIVEGLAEYYAIELLHRAGGISARRHASVYDSLAAWVEREAGQLRDPSSGPHTAQAVLLFRELNQTLNGRLDELIGFLPVGPISRHQLVGAVGEIDASAAHDLDLRIQRLSASDG